MDGDNKTDINTVLAEKSRVDATESIKPDITKIQIQEPATAISNEPTAEMVSKGENLKDDVGQISQETEVKSEVNDAQTYKQDDTPRENLHKRPKFDIDGGAATNINEASLIKFRNNFFEVIEELRIQRALDLENEERIKTLMTEKHELERRKEEEISKCNALVEQYTQQESDNRKQQEDRLQQFGEEKAKQVFAAECTEKEIKILKDEVRALHLVKYNLEKKIKEQERLIQLQNTARDSHESQMTSLEQRCKSTFDQCTILTDLVDRTEANVSAVSRLHKKLMYTNEHQKCSLDSYKKELEVQKFQFVSLKATMAQEKDSFLSKEDEKLNRVNALEQELRMQNEVSRQLQSQLDDSRKLHENLADSLRQAHKLLDRHVESINKHCELKAVAQQELDEVKTECQTLRETLKDKVKEKESFEENLQKQEATWNEERQNVKKLVEKLQREYDSLSQAHNSLEQLNSNWSEKNIEQRNEIETMRREVEELKEKLIRAKEEVQSQSGKMEEVKANRDNEISHLSDQLARAKADCKRYMDRSDSLQARCAELDEKIVELTHKETEEDMVQNKRKDIADASVQTDGNNKGHSALEEAQGRELVDQTSHGKNTKLLPISDKSHSSERNVVLDMKDWCKINSKEPSQEVAHASSQHELDSSETATFTEAYGSGHHRDGLDIFKERAVLHNEKSPTQELDVAAGDDSKAVKPTEYTDPIVLSTVMHCKESRCLMQAYTRNESSQAATHSDGEDISVGKSMGVVISKCNGTENGAPETEKPSISAPDYKNIVTGNTSSKNPVTELSDAKVNAIDKTRKVNMSESDPKGDTNHIPQSESSSTTLNLAAKVNENQASTALDNITNKAKLFKKQVRFSLETNSSTPVQCTPQGKETPENSNGVPAGENQELQVIFLDEEDNGNDCKGLDEDVSLRISRIQSLLKNDRLRTNRKRKHPVI